jgi:hypothetical protein
MNTMMETPASSVLTNAGPIRPGTYRAIEGAQEPGLEAVAVEGVAVAVRQLQRGASGKPLVADWR